MADLFWRNGGLLCHIYYCLPNGVAGFWRMEEDLVGFWSRRF